MIVNGMQGLGENLSCRPVIRAGAAKHGELWLRTPYAFLFRDIPGVHPIRHGSRLRMQAKHEATEQFAEEPPSSLLPIDLRYDQRRGNLHEQLAAILDVPLLPMDLPPLRRPAAAPCTPYVVLRPCTVRREWPNPARNCDPAYIDLAGRIALDHGLTVVFVADFEPGQEVLVGRLPPHTAWPKDLTTPDLLGLVAHAAGTVGPVGWLALASWAARVPHLSIYGGRGAFNRPETELPPDARRSPLFRAAIPDRFCRNCQDAYHQCDRHITGIAEIIDAWATSIRPAKSAASLWRADAASG